jgi:Tol biopolymer transport system component
MVAGSYPVAQGRARRLSLTLPGKEESVRAALAILAACLVAGCGTASSGPPRDEKPSDLGVLVFGGTMNPNARHPPPAYYALRPDGSGARKLAYAPTDGDLSFSADGRFAVMTTTLPDDRSAIAVMRVDGSARRVLTFPGDPLAYSPSLSPDGQTIAFAYAPNFDAPEDLWTISVGGKNLTRLTSTGNVTSVAWSPDGEHIAFADEAEYSDGTYPPGEDLYVIRRDGTQVVRVGGSSDGWSPPAWSPDGNRIAFGDFKRRIAVVDVEAKKTTVLGSDGEAPTWSPDGKRLAFIRGTPCRGYVACNWAKIVVLDVGGSAPPREIGPTFGQPRSLSWTSSSALSSEGTTARGSKPSS